MINKRFFVRKFSFPFDRLAHNHKNTKLGSNKFGYFASAHMILRNVVYGPKFAIDKTFNVRINKHFTSKILYDGFVKLICFF